MVITQKRHTKVFGFLLLLVLVSNFALYRLPIDILPAPSEARFVVLGSLVDLAIIAPILILALTKNKGFTIKRFITFMVLGVIIARLFIPSSYFEPFTFLPYTVIAMEGLLVIAEIALVFLFIKHMPSIIRALKQEQGSPLFTFPALVEKKVSQHPLLRVISAESLLFYYSCGTWKKKIPEGEGCFSLHRNTSQIAFSVMLIHAVVVETFAFHWIFHEKSIVLSIILLVLNIYTVLYFIGDIQAIRYNPLRVLPTTIQVSLGLGKKMEIPFEAIETVQWGHEIDPLLLKEKDTISFIARDFEEFSPHVLLTCKEPLQATLFLGIEKKYKRVAIRLDEPARFRNLLDSKLHGE